MTSRTEQLNEVRSQHADDMRNMQAMVNSVVMANTTLQQHYVQLTQRLDQLHEENKQLRTGFQNLHAFTQRIAEETRFSGPMPSLEQLFQQ